MTKETKIAGATAAVLNFTFRIHRERPWNKTLQKAIYPNAIGIEIC